MPRGPSRAVIRAWIGRWTSTGIAFVAVAAAIVLGATLIAKIGMTPSAAEARPAAVSTAPSAAQQAAASRSAAARAAAGGLQNPTAEKQPAAVKGTPVRILIPAIDVDAPVQRLARDSKGVLQPPDEWASAGWYAAGVVPGGVGPAVIAGHLDTTKRAAVFVNLRMLRPGNRIEVVMSNHRTVRFVVTSARVVKKALFPSAAVYGPTPDAELHLITCSEPFDEVHGIYADNLVVFATKVA